VGGSDGAEQFEISPFDGAFMACCPRGHLLQGLHVVDVDVVDVDAFLSRQTRTRVGDSAAPDSTL
jgi:hypothetical protein